MVRKCYGRTRSVKYEQVLILKQLLDEKIRNLQVEFARHPGITKTKIANTVQLLQKCEQSIKESQNHNRLTRPASQSQSENITGPRNVMKIDMFRETPASYAYEHIVTAEDANSRFL